MKTLIVFILLKIAEVIAAALIYVGLSAFGYWLDGFTPTQDFVWYSPICFILGVSVVVLGLFLCLALYMLITKALPLWINSNWSLSKKLTNKK